MTFRDQARKTIREKLPEIADHDLERVVASAENIYARGAGADNAVEVGHPGSARLGPVPPVLHPYSASCLSSARSRPSARLKSPATEVRLRSIRRAISAIESPSNRWRISAVR